MVVGAESDQIVALGAGSNAGGVIVGVRVGARASRLEDPGVGRGLARLRCSEAARAAVPWRVEGGACTLTCHSAPTRPLHL